MRLGRNNLDALKSLNPKIFKSLNHDEGNLIGTRVLNVYTNPKNEKFLPKTILTARDNRQYDLNSNNFIERIEAMNSDLTASPQEPSLPQLNDKFIKY